MSQVGTFLVVQWLRLHASTAGGTGLIPHGILVADQGSKIKKKIFKSQVPMQLVEERMKRFQEADSLWKARRFTDNYAPEELYTIYQG